VRLIPVFGYKIEVVKCNELHQFKVPTNDGSSTHFRRINCLRHISTDYELRPVSAEAFVHIAFNRMLLRRST
jgi:hypothetical protein